MTVFRIGRALVDDCCGGATIVFISITYNGWVLDDPFAADVFGAGGSVLGSCEGKLGAIYFYMNMSNI